jgi:AraC family cel operon transcriptional repressor
MPADPVFIHHTLSDSLPPGACAAVTRSFFRPGSSYCTHDHDFCEVFWVEDGTAVHLHDGVREELPSGTVVFIRPSDAHAFATLGDQGVTMVNVVLDPAALARLRTTYAGMAGEWPWPDAEHCQRPVHRQLDRRGLDAVQAWADALVRLPNRFAFDGLILTLIACTAARAVVDEAPIWLRQAVIAFGSPPHLTTGTTGFARLADRGLAHLNRSVRRYYGMTATGLVNRIRLEQASRRLGMTDDAIADIARACGFASISYFYRAFRRRYAETPQAWRHRHRAQTRVGWS